MREKRYVMTQVKDEHQDTNKEKNVEFIQNYETALLLSLLEKQLLTQRQFDLCMEELHKMK